MESAHVIRRSGSLTGNPFFLLPLFQYTMERPLSYTWLFNLWLTIVCFDRCCSALETALAVAVETIDTIPSEQAIQHRLRKTKHRFFHRESVSSAQILFPGLSPERYHSHELVYIFTEKVSSSRTNIPYKFYDLPGCPMAPMKRYQRMSIGERLQGVDWKPFPQALRVGHKLSCTPLCPLSSSEGDVAGTNPLFQPLFLEWNQVESFRKLIDYNYRVHLSLDQFPVVVKSSNGRRAIRGYPVGFTAPVYTGLPHKEYYLYNHLKFVITVRRLPQEDMEMVDAFHITGFDVYPASIDHALDGSTCSPSKNDKEGDEDRVPLVNESINGPDAYLALRLKQNSQSMPVIYTYEVEWKESEREWSDRWDIFLMGSTDDDVHLFAIINSFMIVLFVSGVIATMFCRVLRKDITTFNELPEEELELKVNCWKLVQHDVFRPPSCRPMVFSVLVGTGAQLVAAVVAVTLMTILKLVNPYRTGQMLTATVMFYVLSGVVGGYVSARCHKFCDLQSSWKMNALVTASVLPGLVFGVFCLLNIFLSVWKASSTMSIGMLLYFFFLWVGILAPLVLTGAYWGNRAEKLSVPVHTNDVARPIPSSSWYNTPLFSFLLGGMLPFVSVAVEFHFVLTALWYDQIYYSMDVLLLEFLLVSATCAQVSMVLNYLQLCAEDHRWWWRSFWNCASAGLYLFLYSLWFLVSRLNLAGLLPVVIYLTYMFLISLGFCLFCGSIGFGCAFWFNRQIYRALKVGLL
jgi:transmembrane 9 superfamily member 2/4